MAILQVMIRTIIFGIFFLFLLAPLVSAATNVTVSNNADDSTNNVSVKSSTTGSSTICTNGECKTVEGKSESKVCVDGECYESTDGNIDVKSEDGNTTVTINNSKVSSDSSDPEITPKPEKEKKFFNKKITKEEFKEKIKEKEHNWVESVGINTLNFIKKILLFSIF